MADNGEIKIERGVPMPHRVARQRKYPFAQMDVGDSFLVPLDGVDRIRVQNSVCSTARGVSGRKFCTSMVEGGVRVWRIE